MTNNFHQIAPWAQGRVALYPFLEEREAALRGGDVYCKLPCDAVRKTIQLPFREMVQREDLFAAIVEPAVEDLDGNTALAPVLFDLLGKTLSQMNAESSVALYQLLISNWRWNFRTLDELDALLKKETILDHPLFDPYFLWMLQNTPDEHPVKFSLYMLRRAKAPVSKEILHLFALHDRFSGWACGTIAAWYEDAEDMLIDIAKTHDAWGRVHALDSLKSVVKPENKTWLLREGYKNRVLEIYTVYAAAFHGGLIDRLRETEVALDELLDLATILSEMSSTGGPPGVPDLDDYVAGPEACRLLIEHCQRKPLDERLFWHVARIVSFAESGYIDEPDDRPAIWIDDVRHELSKRGRAYLRLPGWPAELIARWARLYEEETPSVDWLADGDLTNFHQVLRAAEKPENLEPAIDWASAFLALDESDGLRAARRSELEEMEMPGVCSGGIYGLTEPKLHSVYGQIILQLLQALAHAPGIGWKIIQAGLRSDTRFHRLVAAEALTNWPDDRLNPEIAAELLDARQKSDDEKAVAAIDALLGRIN